MNENKLKNFLVNGFQALDDRQPEAPADEDVDNVPETPDISTDAPDVGGEERFESPAPAGQVADDRLRDIEDELLKMRYILEDLRDRDDTSSELPDLTPYLTSKEQHKSVISAIERKDTEISNKALVRAMEQISTMREDFFKLCNAMRSRIDTMSAADVLSSFEAYGVDMENILSDGGVYIGPFPYNRLNTLHQRIIGVVPTDEEEKNGMIAERLSDGYKMGSKVLLKEKVTTYKYQESVEAEETVSETDSESEEKTSQNQEEEE